MKCFERLDSIQYSHLQLGLSSWVLDFLTRKTLELSYSEVCRWHSIVRANHQEQAWLQRWGEASGELVQEKQLLHQCKEQKRWFCISGDIFPPLYIKGAAVEAVYSAASPYIYISRCREKGLLYIERPRPSSTHTVFLSPQAGDCRASGAEPTEWETASSLKL